MVEPDPILPTNASVGNSTPSTIAGPATCHTGDPPITPVVHPSLQSTVTRVKTCSHCMGSSNDIAGFHETVQTCVT